MFGFRIHEKISTIFLHPLSIGSNNQLTHGAQNRKCRITHQGFQALSEMNIGREGRKRYSNFPSMGERGKTCDMSAGGD